MTLKEATARLEGIYFNRICGTPPCMCDDCEMYRRILTACDKLLKMKSNINFHTIFRKERGYKKDEI